MSQSKEVSDDICKGKFYDSLNRRLVFIGKKGDSGNFWDTHWSCDDFAQQIRKSKAPFVVGNTLRYLQVGDRILEGGCGRGDKVYALMKAGFDAYGIDFAEETVKKTNEAFPELKVSFGDVRRLPFVDNFFNGCWSLGVIEHFYDGYGPIVKEMFRVLGPGGYVFLTVPTMSPFRKLKILLKRYPEFLETTKTREMFYQFALPHRQVRQFFEAAGFEYVQHRYWSWFKGFKDECSLLKPFLQGFYDGKTLFHKLVNRMLIRPSERVFSPLLGHMSFFVFRKMDMSGKNIN
jgi:SAM-dependent methyltransferase